MNILHIKYAVEVAKLGSVSKASEILFTAQPNISRSIRELENDLGIEIFSRSAKAVSPADNHFVMTFTVGHRAGALGRAVSVIGDHGFNLEALKSRPTKNQNWDYYFFVEGEGNIHDQHGQAMLHALQNYCSSVKVLGSFEVK